MKKAIFAVGALISAIALVLRKSDFGAAPTASDRREYRKRCSGYNGRRFTYPAELEEKGLDEDIRLSGKGTVPVDKLPVYTPDFSAVGISNVSVTWFGHSSVLMQIHGMNVLFDPVFSKRSSPFQWIGPKRFTRPSVAEISSVLHGRFFLQAILLPVFLKILCESSHITDNIVL